MLEKTCTKCKCIKPISLFRNDYRLKSGKGSVCLDCTRKSALDRRNKDVERARQNYKKWAANNKEYDSARKMKWAKENPKSKALTDKKSYYKHREKKLESNKKYRLANIEALKEKSKQWRKKNIGYILAKNSERRAAKIKRTPPWLSQEELLAIQDIYKQARHLTETTGTTYHVDHIIPLHGLKVSGLHVLDNLRIVTAEENLKKHRKYEIT